MFTRVHRNTAAYLIIRGVANRFWRRARRRKFTAISLSWNKCTWKSLSKRPRIASLHSAILSLRPRYWEIYYVYYLACMCVCLCTNTHVRIYTIRQHSAIVIPFTYISLTALKHIFFLFLFRLTLIFSRASLVHFRSLSSASSGFAIAVSAYYTTFSFTLRNWY